MRFKDRFFLTWEDGRPFYQGRILEVRPGGQLRVLLFSWMDGGPCCEQVIPRSETMTLHKTIREMWYAYIDYMCAREGADRRSLELYEGMLNGVIRVKNAQPKGG